jgi:DNA-directed RNA polymerase specialized sigma24 family protein
MALLGAPVALHDIRDAEAFVQATLNASRRVYSPDEREELVAEGLRIMVELHARFEPHRNGYAGEGRFSGFCAKYLRLKLEDAYHRLHPEHRLVTQPDGRRRYLYGDKAVSLDALTGEDPDREQALADRTHESDVLARLGAALDERWVRKRGCILNVGDLLGQGASHSDVAHMLGLTSGQVQEAVQEIMLVADRLRSDDV